MILSHIRSSFLEAFFPRLSEWFASFVIFFTGIMLTVSDSIIMNEIISVNGRGYKLLTQFADQPTWAFILVMFGLIRLSVLLINGAWQRSPWGRATTAFISCFFWTQLVLSSAPTLGFDFVMACGWLGTDMVNVMRAMRDARIVDDALRAREKGSGLE